MSSILQSIITISFTGLLSGVLIPYIVGEIQRKKSRNELILQAQNKLLDNISKTLLTYQNVLLDISWFKSDGDNEEMHLKAFERYKGFSMDLITDWRLASGKLQYLGPGELSKQLDEFQAEMFLQQDDPMWKLIAKGTSEEWYQLHLKNLEMLSKARKLIIEIAKGMKISKENIR